jgi:SAM-dependent MidA family methyltransferase
MTPAGAVLAGEILRDGPIPFRRFMETALYHPEHGYYRRDRFGKAGDFYTAEQVQPVFGVLVAARIRSMFREMGEPGGFSVVEPGAGRAEMADVLSEWRYVPIEIGSGELPGSFRGVVFSNEFFDALPVETAVFRGGAFLEERVGFEEGRFVWRDAGPVRPEVEDYLRRYFPEPEEGRRYEAAIEALGWMERIARALEEGFILTIDYGFTRIESVRFPAGTLMGYRRHTAREDVLADPGERDITAHVNFTALAEHGARHGLAAAPLRTLARFLLDAGEPDRFAAALGANEDLRRRMQLKTLLFGMGETFRVLEQRKRS